MIFIDGRSEPPLAGVAIASQDHAKQNEALHTTLVATLSQLEGSERLTFAGRASRGWVVTSAAARRPIAPLPSLDANMANALDYVGPVICGLVVLAAVVLTHACNLHAWPWSLARAMAASRFDGLRRFAPRFFASNRLRRPPPPATYWAFDVLRPLDLVRARLAAGATGPHATACERI